MSVNVEALFQRLLSRQGPGSEIETSRLEIRILQTLFHKGEATMSDLANSLAIPISTLTRAIDRLVEKKLTERIRSEEDRRIVQVVLSSNGKAIGNHMRKTRENVAREMLLTLSLEERGVFLELLGRITSQTLTSNGASAEE